MPSRPSPRRPLAFAAALALTSALASSTAHAEELKKSAKLPLVVHHEGASDAAFADAILAAVEDAWRYQTEVLGFPPPPPDAGKFGSDDYDVFVKDNEHGGVCKQGAPVPGKPGAFRSHLEITPSLPFSAIPLVTSHELHHAIQMGICGDGGSNAAESGALYVSGIHRFGEANQLTYSLGINTFQKNPERSLDWEADLGDPYPYGSGLFLMFLDQKYGNGDARLVTKVWDAMAAKRTEAGCPHYFEGIRAVVDFEAAFREFVRARYFVGPADDKRHLRDLDKWEGGALPQKKLLSVTLGGDHAELPVEGATPATLPMPYGASYVRLSLAGLAPTDEVRLSFEGETTVRWSLQTILLTEGAPETSAPADEASVDVDASGAHTMDIPVGNHATLVVAFVNLGDGKYVGDGPGWKGKNLRYSFAKVEPAPAAPPPAAAEPSIGRDDGCAVGSVGRSRWGGAGLAAALAAGALARRSRTRSRARPSSGGPCPASR